MKLKSFQHCFTSSITFFKENFLLLFPAFLCKMKIWIFWNFAKIVIR